MKRILIVVLLIINVFLCFSQEPENFKSALDKFIIKKKNKLNVTGVSVALMIDNTTILSKGYGFADKEAYLPADENTQYAIGSVSKMITSTAVLKLYNEDKIDIDRPYIDYVPEFSMKKHFVEDKPFTIRHLLTHFAGIPRVHAKGYCIKEERPLSRILDISSNSYLISPPGVVYQYSDWGVDLLAVLVEKVSGQTFREYVNENLFKPLDMKKSGFGKLISTKSYNKGVLSPTYEYSYDGSDGVNSSVEDIMKLGQMYLNDGKFKNEQYLKKAIAKDALTPHFNNASLNLKKSQGLMWDDIYRDKKYTRIIKWGVHEPFMSVLIIIPEYNMTLAICSNSNSSSAIHWEIYYKVVDYLSKKKNESPSGISNPEIEPVTLTDYEFNKLEGVYSTNLGIVSIIRNGKKVKLIFEAEGKTLVGKPYSDNIIRVRFKLLGIIPVHIMDIFWHEVNEEIVVGEYSYERKSIGGVKIEQKSIPIEWQRAVGKYQASNLNNNEYTNINEIQLKINKYGFLEISGNILYPQKFSLQLPLISISNNLATIPGYSFNFFAGETVELSMKEDKNTILFSGYEFIKIE